MRFGSIAEFVRFLDTRRLAVEEGRKEGMEAAGKMLVKTTQDYIGQEMPDWADLAPSTVEEKSRLGFTGRVSPTDPLLRTGELRASISHSVDGNKLTLGSDDPVASYQEFGTARIPPRPFIGAAMHVFGPEAANIIANYELGAATGLRGPLKPLPDHQEQDRLGNDPRQRQRRPAGHKCADGEQTERGRAGNAHDHSQHHVRPPALAIQLTRSRAHHEIRKVADHGCRL